MTLRIGRPSEAGTAIINVGDRCITVQQYKPVDLVVAAGFVGRVVLEGFYRFGVKTKQVDSESTIDAVSIKLVTEAQYKPEHVTLYNLNVPANATSLQASYISDAKRDDVDIAVDSSIYRDLAAHIASPTAHTKSQVGLGNVNNWGATASVSDNSDAKYATAGAVKKAYDLAAAAFPKTGGSVNGFVDATGHVRGRELITTTPAGADFYTVIKSESGYSMLFKSNGAAVGKASEFIGIGTSDIWYRRDNGTGDRKYTDHKIYHQGFKPTATDVGLNLVNNWPATSAVNDASDAKYATAGAVKRAYDLAATKLDSGANAVSATKLATPRQINGTNFDGTANITTALWGTSRTLTIGNSAKSVNGSVNVSWSLAEIGAVPAADVTSTGEKGKIPRISGSGVLEIGRYIDFHSVNTATDYDMRIDCQEAGILNVVGGVLRVGGYDVYHKNNRPTATDVGALSSNGGTVNGPIVIKSSAPILALTETDSADKTYRLVVDGGHVRLNVNDTSLSDPSVVWRWNDDVKEFYTPGKVIAKLGLFDGTNRAYSAINKPTPADLGALDVTGGAISGNLALGGILSHSAIAAANKQLLNAGGDQVYLGSRDGIARVHIQTIGGEAFVSAGLSNHRIYHQGFKPTATDVQALSLSGGTVEGNVRINGMMFPYLPLPVASKDIPTQGIYICDTGGESKDGYESLSSVIGVAPASSVARHFQMMVHSSGASFKIRAAHTSAESGTGWNPWYRVYTEAFKPTAADVGALSLAGGTVTGLITANRFVSSNSFGLKTGTTADGSCVVVKAESGYALFAKENNSATKADEFIGISPSSVLQFRQDNGSGERKYVDHRIYHSGYKPTATDVGALALTGGTVEGDVTIKSNSPILRLEEADHATTPYMFVVNGGNIRLNVRTGSLLDGDVVWKWTETNRELYTPGKMMAAGGLYDGANRAFSDSNQPAYSQVRNALGKASCSNGLLGDIRHNGIIHVGSGVTDKPSGAAGQGDSVFSTEWNVDAGNQLYLAYSQPIVAIRRKRSGAWGDWSKLYHEEFKPTATDVGLGNVQNWAATSSVNDASDAKYATAGAVKKAYDLAAAALPKAGGVVGELTSNAANTYRQYHSSTAYGVFSRIDAGSYYLMVTERDDPLGGFSALRPFQFKLDTGDVYFGHNVKAAGTVTTARVLMSVSQGSEVNSATRRDYVDGELAKKANNSITINGHPLTSSFDVSKTDVGLSNVQNWPATGAVDDSSNAKYATTGAVKKAYDLAAAAVPKAGGVVTGVIRCTGATGGISIHPTSDNSTGIFNGTGDGASQAKTNIQIKSWYGIGICPTAGSSLEPGLNSIWFDARTGAISTIGELYAQSDKKVYHQGFKPTAADVGLGSVNNWGATASVSDNSDAKYATAGAVKKAYDLAAGKAPASHSHSASEGMRDVITSAAYAHSHVGCTAMLVNMRYNDREIQPGQHMTGSDLAYSNADATIAGGTPPGTWKSLGYAAKASAAAISRVGLFIRIA
ncbi:MAG: tail fiber protein [Aeromonas veronii]